VHSKPAISQQEVWYDAQYEKVEMIIAHQAEEKGTVMSQTAGTECTLSRPSLGLPRLLITAGESRKSVSVPRIFQVWVSFTVSHAN
jgi:hypothetical protein